MENEEPAAGLLRTRASDPQWWAGPSWSISASTEDDRAAFAASGYFQRLWRWEGRLDGMVRAGNLPDGCPAAADATFVSDSGGLLLDDSWSSVHLNVELPSLGPSGLEPLLRSLAPHDCADVMEATGLEPVPVTAHVPLRTSNGTSVVDFEVPTLPSRRGDRERTLSFGVRRARLVITSRGPVVLWSEIEGPWDIRSIPWPHHAMPSMSLAWTEGTFATARTPHERLHDALGGLCDHVAYQQTTWQVEHEHWEHGLFAQFGDGPSTFEGLDLVRHQRELVTLADFLGRVRVAQRAVARRRIIDPPLMVPAVSTMLAERGEAIAVDLDEARRTVRDSFALVANIASGQQSVLAEQQRDATNQLQGLITMATSVLLVPALVVSIYGANLRELSEGSRGDLWTLLSLMVVSALGASVLVRVVAGRRLLRRGSKSVELGMGVALGVLAVAAILAALRGVVPTLLGASIAILSGVSSICAVWSAVRLRGAQDQSG